MLRRLGVLLVALLLVAVIGDTLVWYFVVRQMRAGLEDWATARRADGWSIAATTPEPGGWPVAATLTMHQVEIHGGMAAIPGGVDWGAERLVLRLAARHPHVFQIDATGAQHLRLSGAPDIAYTARRLQLLVPLQQAPSAQTLELQGEAVRAALASGGSTDKLTIDRMVAHAVSDPAAARGQPALMVTADAAGIGLPTRFHWALGAQIDSFSLDAALNGPVQPAPGLTAAATAWRDGGGSMTLHQLATKWGPMDLAATGTLTLDAQLQPAGSGAAQVTGYGATLDALAREGVMSRSAAMTATALLSLLAEAPAGGGPPAVEVPLLLRDRVLSMQRVPLLRIPTLDWPQP